MANIRPNQLPAATSVNPASAIIVDAGGPVQKATPIQVVDAARPKATQDDAETGTDNEKIVTPLRVAQAIDALGVSRNTLESTDPGDGASIIKNEGGQTLQEKSDEIKSIADFSTVAQALASTAPILLPTGTFELPADPSVGDGFSIESAMGGAVYQPAEATPGIDFDTQSPKRDNTRLVGVNLSQIKGAPIGGGTDNNHALAKYRGGNRHKNIGNNYDGQYGISFGYGASGETDRRTLYNVACGNTFRDMEGMAIENLGCAVSAIVGNAGSGANPNNADGRATFHAIRVSGYKLSSGDSTDAQAIGIVGAANAFSGFSNGLSLQNASSYFNFASQYFENCDAAIHIPSATDVDSAATMGIASVTSRLTDRVIFNLGGNRSEFNFASDASNVLAATPAIEELSLAGAHGFNHYRGILLNPTAVGALLRYDHNAVDIRIDGGGAGGLLVAGDYCRIDAILDDVTTFGVSITGNNNTGRIIATNCGSNGLAISGSNNVIHVMTDGDVSITGNNNIISGKAAGTITNSGTGNILAGLNPLKGSATYDPASIPAGGVVTTTITITGANRLIHGVSQVSFSRPLQGIVLTAWVNDPGGSVTVQFYNPTAGAVDLANGAINVVLSMI